MSGSSAAAADTAALLAKLRAAREHWVEVAPGKRLKFLRPTEAEQLAFVRVQGNGRQLVVELEQVQRFAVDWAGFTEADLLGQAVGVSDAVPFDSAVFAEVIADHLEWLQPAAEGLLQLIVGHRGDQATAEKNSAATSVPGPA